MSTAPQPARQNGSGMSVLKILGIIFLVLVLLCGGLGVWMAMNFRNWAATGIETVVVQAVAQSNLPAEQRDSIQKNVSELTAEFKAGKISVSELGMVFSELMEGPFLNLVMLEGLRYEHERVVKANEEQRASITRLFQRFERGIAEKTFPISEIEQTLSSVTVTDAGGTRTQKPNLTAEDLKAFVAAIKSKVNEAKIPDEPYEVDFAAIINDAVKKIAPSSAKPKKAPKSGTSATRPAATQPAHSPR